MYGDGVLGDLALGELEQIPPAITPDGVARQLRELATVLATTTDLTPYQIWQLFHKVLGKAAHDLAGRPATRAAKLPWIFCGPSTRKVRRSRWG